MLTIQITPQSAEEGVEICQAIAQVLRVRQSGPAESHPTKNSCALATPKNAAAEPMAAPPAPTLEEVRAKLTELSRAGKTTAVKDLLAKHGVASVTKLHESSYTAVLAEARGLL